MTSTASEIRSRLQLITTLYEAAELEHNLMCMYLFAIFSLKQSQNESLSEEEFSAVSRWRKALLEVCIQEMGHLAIVNNLIVAVGGTVQFGRSDFPVKSGLFPKEFVMELAPFKLRTLEHFIFLERPEGMQIPNATDFVSPEPVDRRSYAGHLMANSGNYKTVGQLYSAVAEGIRDLCESLGEASVFCGPRDLQLTDKDVKLEGLRLISSRSDALHGLDLIVEQGEGGQTDQNSHFAAFNKIKEEFEHLLLKNPQFSPSRNVVTNPVLMKPVAAHGGFWLTNQRSAFAVEIGNSIYALMLRFLTQSYSMEDRPAAGRKILVDGAFQLMHCLSVVASEIPEMPADAATDADSLDLRAGLSFDISRHFGAVEVSAEKLILSERLNEISNSVEDLKLRCSKRVANTLAELRAKLIVTQISS
ncbi:MAG: hypothetical protein EOP05_06105 [Proteobacteria bacterium]|nr:MAG: hypothetical protein EOP05_06105 [Pseudomonadota bacterium]